MTVTIEVNDKVWADFCLSIPHPGCGCGGDPGKHLSTALGAELIQKKAYDYIYQLYRSGLSKQETQSLVEVFIKEALGEYGIE